jgi:hypothetical protein
MRSADQRRRLTAGEAPDPSSNETAFVLDMNGLISDFLSTT